MVIIQNYFLLTKERDRVLVVRYEFHLLNNFNTINLTLMKFKFISGTGGAGLFGSFSYAALISIGLTPFNTLMIMLSVPLLEGATFWILLRNPNKAIGSNPQAKHSPDDEDNSTGRNEMKFSLANKIYYIRSLLKYMIPLALVFLFEYFINQGLVRSSNFLYPIVINF